MTRHEIRQTVFSLLYMNGFYEDSQLDGQLDLYFKADHEGEYSDEDEQYIREKLRNIVSKAEEIDGFIDESAKGWKISRLNKVDLCILRLAVYEMLYDDGVPYKVAINEAVDIAKQYGGEDSPAFINGILGKIASWKGLLD